MNIYLQGESISGFSKNLRWHQNKTAEAVKEKDIVVNTFPTGSGKTRAAQAAFDALKPELTVTIAPTNELVSQHFQDWKKHIEDSSIPIEVIKVTSEDLEHIRHEYNERSHGSALNEKLSRNEKAIIVSNPDIIHYILSFSYSNDSSTRELYSQLINADFWIFDEFHVYDESQLLSFGILLSQMSLAKQKGIKNNQKVLVMSATPSNAVKDMLEESKVEYVIVSQDDEPSDLEKIPILSSVELEITSEPIEKYLEENIEKVKRNANELDQVLISDSIKRISECREILKKNSIDSKLIVGPSSQKERKRAVSSHFILATPTVDIGFNFSKVGKERQNVDILYFEAKDASSFIQRLGRLGRVHGKKITDKISKGVAFVDKKYMPSFEKLPKEMNRKEFSNELKNIMGEKSEEFRHYYSKWGHVNIGVTLQFYKKMLTQETVEKMYSKLKEIMMKVFGAYGLKKNAYKYFFLRVFEEKFLSSKSLSSFLKETLNYVPDPLKDDFVRYFFEHSCGSQIKETLKGWSDKSLAEDFIEDFASYERFFQKMHVDEHAERYFNFLKNMFSFRSWLNIPVAVYDPSFIVTGETPYFIYELFPLVRGYEIELTTAEKFPSFIKAKKPIAYYKVLRIRKNGSVNPHFKIKKPQGSKRIFIPESIKLGFHERNTEKSMGVEYETSKVLTRQGLICMTLRGLSSEKLKIFASRLGIYTYNAKIEEGEEEYSSNVLFGKAAMNLSWFDEDKNDEITFWDVFS